MTILRVFYKIFDGVSVYLKKKTSSSDIATIFNCDISLKNQKDSEIVLDKDGVYSIAFTCDHCLFKSNVQDQY